MAATPVVLGPKDGTITVRTYREGMAARAGHDLVMEAVNWNASAQVDHENLADSSVQATVDLRSLEIRKASGGVKPMSDGDRKDIFKNLAKTLLTERHPEVTFHSRTVTPNGASQLHVHGDLTLAGKTQPVTLELSVQPEGDKDHLVGSVTLHHTHFGVKPYQGFLGALKIRDAVEIDLDLRVPRN
ncbi:MAG TPA: YceI family protein [Candidatus Dormibacteraeota bacterium]